MDMAMFSRLEEISNELSAIEAVLVAISAAAGSDTPPTAKYMDRACCWLADKVDKASQALVTEFRPKQTELGTV